MNRTLLLFAATTLLALGMSASAGAQSPPAQQQTPLPPRAFMIHHGPGMAAGTFAYERIMGDFNGTVVKNAPFSAQITRENIQVLADGNRIDRKVAGTIARDAAGRTRRGMSFPAIGPLTVSGQVPRFVFIADPIAGKNYILNENRKIAHVMNVSLGGKFAAKRFAKSQFMARRHLQLSTESLGTKTIDGLTVQGTRTTRTIPAGQIGNEKPIVITTEKWYSPDLQTTVSFTRTDPRFGTTTYQLTNINRADPPQSLFMVPPDYTVRPVRIFKRKFPSPAPAPGHD